VIWASTSFALDGDVVVRLLSAAVLGGMVGAEREASDQPAGLRTHIAVALGASLFGVISTLGFLEFDQPRAFSTVQVDVSRVASNVAVGIGFLGAGVIFRQGNTIRNLTTAASLWTVAAIGLACGVGDPTTAAVGTVVLLGSLVLLRPIRNFIRSHHTTTSTTVRLTLRPGADTDEVLEEFRDVGRLETSDFKVRKADGRVVVLGTVGGRPADVGPWLARLAASPDVESIDEE
jgi:putative Mg2+ transporter-C (MgtC) family protein